MPQATFIDARQLSREVALFAQPLVGRSIREILTTAIPFVLLWILAFGAYSWGSWLGIVPSILAGGLLLRLFLIQHDCGHGAMFRRRSTNDMVGRAISVLTLTPYDFWRRAHAVHHATSGNLSKRGTGDIDTLTVEEYRRLNRRRRLVYRIYRSPLGLLGIGPTYLFLLRHRLPVGFMRSGWRPWVSALGTNAAIGCLANAMTPEPVFESAFSRGQSNNIFASSHPVPAPPATPSATR